MDESINRQMLIAQARSKLPLGIRKAIAVFDPLCLSVLGPPQGLQDPLQTENTAAPAGDELEPPPPQEQSQPQQPDRSTPLPSSPQGHDYTKLASWLCSGMPGVQFPDLAPAADSKQDKAQRKLERRQARLEKRKAKLQQKKDLLEIKQIALSVASSPSHFRKIVRSWQGLLKAGDYLGLFIWNMCYTKDPALIGGYRPYRPHRGHVPRASSYKPHKRAWRRAPRRRARPKSHVW